MRSLRENGKGITLVSLVITIVVLLILASIATYTGIEVIKSSRLTTFTTEMKIMQTQVNKLYQEMKDGDTTIKELGKEISKIDQTQVNNVFKAVGIISIEEREKYRYFDQDIIKNLNMEGISGTFLVNIEKRSVISYEGFQDGDEIYYTLEQLPNGLYNVEYEDKSGEITLPVFDTSVESIGDNKWRITVSNIQYGGYIDKWQVNYQLEGQTYWNTSEDLGFIVNQEGYYNIKIANGTVESEEEKVIASNNYISKGLVLRYDGIENTRSGNNLNATSWEDLSGNNNDGIFYNINNNPDTLTDTDKGYYSQEENGYVFLHNDSYVESTNNIGISGDANFTIETVSNLWEDGKNPNYSAYPVSQPAWWGSSSTTVGRLCIFGYHRDNNKMYTTFCNNGIYSDEEINLIGKISYMSFRKTKVGQIKNGDTDIGKMNYNGRNILNTYTGSATFTTNIEDSKVRVGRGWQWQEQNRTLYGSVQAVRIYNRVLTDEEIQHNYELDRERFGME